MSLVRRLYMQFRQLIHEGAKFLVVGGLGLIVTNVVYDLLRTIGPIKAATIATIIATVVTYVGNRYWSFRHRERTGVARESVIFFVLNGVALLMQDAVVGFNAYILGLNDNRVAGFLALNIGIGLGTLFRFWSYRKWVWASPAAPAGGAALLPAAAGPPGGKGQPATSAGTGAAGSSGAGEPTGSPLAQPNGHQVNGNGHLPQAHEADLRAVRRR